MDKHSQVYLEEATELLDELESALLALESSPDDSELVGRVFRAMHTIKGSGSMFGFDAVAAFTHDVETVFDRVRNREIPVTQHLIDLTLSARDAIRTLLGESDQNFAIETRPELQTILNGFQALLPGSIEKETPEPVGGSSAPAPETREAMTLFHIRFKPHADLFAFGTNPLFLLDELEEMGECYIATHFEDIPLLQELEPESCHVWWDVLLLTGKDENAVRDVFIFVEDDGELTVSTIEAGVDASQDVFLSMIRSLLENPDPPDGFLKKMIPSAETNMVPKASPSSEASPSPKASPSSKAKSEGKETRSAVVSSIRVDAEKLDQLVNLVGELVIVQASLSQSVIQNGHTDLTGVAEEVERLTRDLRETAMDIRMIPIGTLFNKFKRLVRDLSKEQGKTIYLEMEGAETELDKTVIERLNDPLVHIIRNSIDHGIEPEAMRMMAGKSKEGHIHLSARHSGADVLITIRDDGKGLNRDAILKKAQDMELVPPEAKLTDKEIFGLIFHPGFSTAKRVSSLSGRGVGMDVVKRNIEALRGSIDVQSEKNRGTCITLRLPLTLGIIEGLLVRIDESRYVVPLLEIEDCVEMAHGNGHKKDGRRLLNVRGDMVPYIRLRETFRHESEAPSIEQVVITSQDGKKVGFVVDEIIGGQQIVIKTLGRMYRQVDNVSGATILGDGTVALILDIQKLAVQAEEVSGDS